MAYTINQILKSVLHFNTGQELTIDIISLQQPEDIKITQVGGHCDQRW
jgi:hypothetical protein